MGKRHGFLSGIAAAAALLFPFPAPAQPAVKVEAVQYPAWLERGGLAVPLAPGIELQGKDRLVTGSNARARLRMSDGSSVKLGENARFEIEQASDTGFLRAALRVLGGAFRYATQGPRDASRRSVGIRVKNVTIGIRGTDLWGKATDEKDWVVLLEGEISVAAQGHPAVQMRKPLDVYELPRDGAPGVRPVDPDELAKWAQETEMRDDGAVGEAGGRWRVVAARPASRGAALALARDLRARGYPARVAEGEAGAFPVQVTGLATEAQAKALAANLRDVEGVDDPQVLQ
jgi:hypothetical protein